MSRPFGAAAGILADHLVGEPPAGAHPVAWFGRALGAVERVLYADRRSRGIAHALVGVGLGGFAGVVTRSTALATYVAVAGRALGEAAGQVDEALAAGRLDRARSLLPALVGRDPDGLDEKEVCRAVIESVAENTVDAVVAPALWAAVLGAPGALGQRAVNTMDAMVGHRDDRYLNYGWAAARLDDVVAWVPARVTVGLVMASRPRHAGAVARVVQGGRRPAPVAEQRRRRSGVRRGARTAPRWTQPLRRARRGPSIAGRRPAGRSGRHPPRRTPVARRVAGPCRVAVRRRPGPRGSTVIPAPGPHGGDGPAIARALGLDPAAVIDLSQSLNPFAPDVAALARRHLDALGHYPDEGDATWPWPAPSASTPVALCSPTAGVRPSRWWPPPSEGPWPRNRSSRCIHAAPASTGRCGAATRTTRPGRWRRPTSMPMSGTRRSSPLPLDGGRGATPARSWSGR